jgi:lipopolysaccharide transport system ATP-binding protein
LSDVAIKIEDLAKRYRIGTQVGSYKTFREALVGVVQAPWKRLKTIRDARRGEGEDTLWALDGVDLEIPTGEPVAIIGANGAGKTTLLKILSRITKPTRGRVELHGRVGSLLEVGTGFHPELTGRENIFLNGAILGMRKAEIARKFDQIVAFAEIDRFLDTAVKHYSSGMYVRLAFAVAAHLEPEILLVDEVLAVGDAEFQKKCMGKMDEVGREGRTVLFVSHNMTAVKALCTRAVLLRDGKVAAQGNTIDVIKEYMSQTSMGGAAERRWQRENAPGNKTARLLGVRIRDAVGEIRSDIDSQQAFSIEIDFENLTDSALLGTTVMIHNEEGECVLSSLSNNDPVWHGKMRPRGIYRSRCEMPANLFPDGLLFVSVWIWGDNYKWGFQESEVVVVQIHETAGSARGDFLKRMAGVVRPVLPWSSQPLGLTAEQPEPTRR